MTTHATPIPVRAIIEALEATHATYEPHVWADTAMGIATYGGQALTPGWIVRVTVDGEARTYHLSETGTCMRKPADD